MRHAKAALGDAEMRDHERPLNARGERAATLVGTWLAQQGLTPDLVLCSTAVRARGTLERAAASWPETRVVVDDRLYLSTPAEIVARIAEAAGDEPTVLVVAHNPGLHELAHVLAGSGDPGALDRLGQGLPTAAIAELRFARGGWPDLAPRSGSLERLVRPKELV